MSGMRVDSRPGLITGEQLARMPDVGPCELVEGKIVWMTPTAVRELTAADALNGEDVLPGFELPVARVFEE